MATITEPRVKSVEGEHRFVLHNVGWEGYQDSAQDRRATGRSG